MNDRGPHDDMSSSDFASPSDRRLSPARSLLSLVLLAGAVAFGVFLAGAGGWTPAAESAGPVAPPQKAVSAELAASRGAAGAFPSFADLAEAVEPTVVSIRVVTFDQDRGRQRGIDPFQFFFGPPGQQRGPQQQQPQQPFRSESGGSGFVVSPDGLVVTNNHVVRDAEDVRVNLGDREYPAEVVGRDPETDIALLKISVDRELDYLALGDSDTLRVGDWIMAIGSPLSLDHSVTVGVVSAKGRSGLGLGPGRDSSFENFIQTDAAINFGNSGGPLVNLSGEVVGIATAINYGAENIGFAVPVNTLRSILPQLRDEGGVRRGYLGIQIANLDYPTAEAFGLERPRGALVQAVTPNTPAEAAGLRHGDIILKVDDVVIEQTRDLIDYVSLQGPDASVELEVLRNGDRITKRIELDQRPDAGGALPTPTEEEDSGIDWLGLQYQNLTPNARQSLSLSDDVEGVWVSAVDNTSDLFEEGVRRGMIISEVNGRATPDVDTFEEVVESARSGAYLRFYVLAFGSDGERAASFFAVVRVP